MVGARAVFQRRSKVRMQSLGHYNVFRGNDVAGTWKWLRWRGARIQRGVNAKGVGQCPRQLWRAPCDGLHLPTYLPGFVERHVSRNGEHVFEKFQEFLGP